MAGKKENIKALFSNTRTRVIILFTVFLISITIGVGVYKFHSALTFHASSDINRTPGIRSIPGAMNQTAQYAALQEQQNIEQAEHAHVAGTSAIPTIIRTQAFGEGVESVGAVGGEGSVGFNTLKRDLLGGPQSSLWLTPLKQAHCDKAGVAAALRQGASLEDLRAGCSCLQLRKNGYNLNDLKSLCHCDELKQAGFTLTQMKDAGFSAETLRQCGFVACEERHAGFSAAAMKKAGYSDGELKGAGFSERDIASAGGLPNDVSEADVRKAGCTADGLSRLRQAGVSAAAIRRISGCSASALKAAGFSAADLKNAGFSAADLKQAGFTPEELKQAGYDARDLLNAGFTPKDLLNAGFSAADINEAESILPPNMTAKNVKDAGCSVEALKRERLAGVSAKLIKKHAGCSANALQAAGFTLDDLVNAGFNPKQLAMGGLSGVDENTIRAAGCAPEKLKELMDKKVSAKQIHDLNGCSLDALKKAGFDARALADAGFTPAELLAAGFFPEQLASAGLNVADSEIRTAGCSPENLKKLRDLGVSAKRIHDLNGCSAAALKQAGFDARALADAGFTPEQLIAAGFTPEQLLAAGFTPEQLIAVGLTPEQLQHGGLNVADSVVRAAGCSPELLKKLRALGISAKRIHDLNGCSAAALKQAGFDAGALIDAGFTPEALLAAGFTPEQLMNAGLGITPAGVIAAGRHADCSVESLKTARALGVTAASIKKTLGCGADAMKAAGYSAADLKDAGFTAAELKNAGFDVNALKAAGFSAKDLKAAGFGAVELKAAGFSAASLKDAGFSASELKEAGFSAAQLKAAGFNAGALKEAGFSADALRKAGYSAKDLKEAGFSAIELKNAGFSGEALHEAGFSSEESAVAGLAALSAPIGQTSNVASIPSLESGPSASKAAALAATEAENAKKLQGILAKQQTQMADQRYQQKIQQRSSQMLAAANQALQGWKVVPQQQYLASSIKEEKEEALVAHLSGQTGPLNQTELNAEAIKAGGVVIKTGDILFAVIDTSVNSDEAGPILATVVSGKLKGSKLIGTFNLPSNADKMVISFNTLSVPGAEKTVSVSAFAIDPNTARTALSSQTDHHYLMRYGSLFASTFLEGFGNAFQSANTTVTIGGTGGVQDTTVSNGIGRSALENAVIGLATLGKAWGQVAQQNMSRPTTVEVFSGTAIGVMFTQDLIVI